MITSVGRNSSPASRAPAAWSIRAKMFIPCARSSVSNRSVVSSGPKLLGTVVRASLSTGKSEAFVNQFGKEVAVDRRATPLRLVGGGGFRCHDFIERFALFFEC